MAGVGLFDVLSYTVALAVGGLVTGLVAAAALTRLEKTQLYHISSPDPATNIAAPAVLLLAVLAAAFLPTLRATRADPVVSLRHE